MFKPGEQFEDPKILKTGRFQVPNIFKQGFYDFRALKLSKWDIFRALKLSKRTTDPTSLNPSSLLVAPQLRGYLWRTEVAASGTKYLQL